MKVQFANGLVYDAESLDDAISKCLSGGNDPFNPQVIEAEMVENKKAKPQDNGNQE